MTTSQWVAIVVIVAIVASGLTYFMVPAKTVTEIVEKEVTPKIKAAWIYVGPIGDYGWTKAHDEGRLFCEQVFPWLETTYVESVSEGDCARVIEDLIADGYTVIFTTSFGFMDPTLEMAKKYPNIIFWHCSGYKRYKNMGTYFSEFYQLYYLNGLMAGALTKTNKIGYVAAHTIPEVVRHINAFAIGVKEVNPDAKVYVRVINAWYDPTKAREAAEALIAEGCDVLAFTEDSPTVIEVGQEYTEKGQQIYTFSHYSPMGDYGPDSYVSGQIAHWEVIYADILAKIYAGYYTTTNLENVDYWWMLRQGACELGGKVGELINPKFEDDLKAVMVTEKITGEQMSVYDLVMLRLKQMSEDVPTFDPFTGPLYDDKGVLRARPGERLGHDELWTMQWWYENVVGPELGG
jgi:simple sugar transport system substrate-binding protein